MHMSCRTCRHVLHVHQLSSPHECCLTTDRIKLWKTFVDAFNCMPVRFVDEMDEQAVPYAHFIDDFVERAVRHVCVHKNRM